MGAKVEGQLGMDETVITDADLEQALEKRWSAQQSSRAVSTAYRLLHVAAKTQLDKAVPEPGVYRIGRFRVERKLTEERHVEFDTVPGVRVTIDADGEDG